MEKFRYYLTDQIGTIITEPLGASDFIITWANEVDGSLRMFVKSFDGSVKFTGEAFSRLLRLEQSLYRCNTQSLVIEKKCASVWQEIFKGNISLNSGEWDLDRCSVTLKFTEENAASCLSDNDSQELNLFAIQQKYQVNTRPGNLTLEYEEYDENNQYEDGEEGIITFPYWSGSVDPESVGYTYYYHFADAQRQSGIVPLWNIIRRTRWVREVLLSPIELTDLGRWIFLEQINGSYKYARPVLKFNEIVTDESQGEGWLVYRYNADFIGKENNNTLLRNGVKLSDVFNLFVAEFCPGLTVKSDFFQVNPENPSDINYVTGLTSKVNNLMLFQASDVKRPTATGSATKLMFDWERLTNALKYMFNVDWRVEGDTLIFEHVSFFPKNIGLDLTTGNYDRYLSGKRVYSYKNEDIPTKEVWQWGGAQSGGDFEGIPITYSSGCIVNKKIEKIYNIEDVYTDVQLAVSNPDSDSKVVDDEAVFIVATGFDGSIYYVLQEEGILSAPRVNNSLAIAQLHRDYHRYDRPLPVGTMNNILTEFITVKPNRQGIPFKIPLCCPNDFNPDDLVKTYLGDGAVNSATYNFKDSTLEIELLYDSFEGLDPNDEPVAVLDTVNTYDQSTILIDVLANDTYEPGDTIEIVSPPTIGTAIIVDNKIEYFVNLGGAGSTFIRYRIKDAAWGVLSNIASVFVNILASNEPPVANTDNYQAIRNQPLIISAAQGVLANDTDDYGGMFVASFDSITEQSGGVQMLSDGSFTYTPAEDFTGSDRFNYVVEDDGGLQSTGIVNISVDQVNVPIAVDDVYSVQAGASLVIDNSPGKPSLIANDYNIDGSPVTALAGQVTSNSGVVINIAANGTFTYVAPGVAGEDRFNYTAVGSGGNSQGLAIVNVLPVIKVGVRLINESSEFDEILCNDVPTEGIRTDFSDVELYFLNALNQPVDVTGLALSVNLRRNYTDEINTSNSFTNVTPIANNTGVSNIVLPKFETYYRENNCLGENTYRYSNSFSVDPGDGYTVI